MDQEKPFAKVKNDCRKNLNGSMLAESPSKSTMPQKKSSLPKIQQVAFRLDEVTFIEFKKKLLDDGNKSVQKFCEEMVIKYLGAKS